MTSNIQNVTFYNPDVISQLMLDRDILKTDVSGLKTGTSGLMPDVSQLKLDRDILMPDVSLMKPKLNTIPINTKDLTASSNNTYVYDTPFQIKSRKMNANRVAETTGIITFPSSPADGDFITLVDSANVFGAEVDTYSYSTVVITINFNGKLCQGECSDGSLLPASKGQVTFKYSTALNKWTSFVLKQNDITSDDPWTGYWTPITYGSNPFDSMNDSKSTNINNSYIYLDATKNPVQQYFYEGTPKKPYNGQPTGSIQRSNIPLISVTGTNFLNTTGTLRALVKFDDPKFGIHQVDQKDIGNYSRYVLDPADPNKMYFYGTRADVSHSYGSTYFDNAIYTKFLQPIPYVKSWGYDDSQVYSFGDPVVLFDWYCDMMTKNCNPFNNTVGSIGVQNKSFYGDSYKIKSFIESVKKDGFSVTTPIKNIIVSITGSTVFNTKENCHYCPPGSNITISGFSGSYAVLNSYYANGVSVNNNNLQNYMHSGTMDYKLTNGIASGSVMDNMNKFAITYDSSNGSVFQRSTGANALYGQGIFEGNPVVTVIHKVTTDMTYNEWIAACIAVKEKIHGPQTNSWIQAAYFTGTNKLFSDWTSSATGSSLTKINTRAGGFPSYNYVKNYGGEFDPYQSRSKLDSLISTDSNLNYDGNIRQDSGVNPLIIHNYLQTGTVANLWYAMDKPYTGTYANTFQQQYSATIGSQNLSNPSLTGGSQFVCEMKPYPYSTGSTLPAYPYATGPTLIYPYSTGSALPDLTVWNLNAPSSNIGKTGTNALSSVYNGINYLYCGLIKPELVVSLGYGSKKVAYLRIPDTSFFFDNPNKFTYRGLNVFNTPVATGSYPHTGALGQLYFASVISKYINDLGANVLILDDRGSSGDGNPQMFFPFFGGDRNGVVNRGVFNDSGYGSFNSYHLLPDIVNSNKLYSDFDTKISPIDMERLFPGSVFKGTSTGPKKIVILHDVNASGGNDEWTRGWLGDTFNGNIGGSVTCSFLGDSDGRLLGGVGSSTPSLPIDSNSKVNHNLAFNTRVNGDTSTVLKRPLTNIFYHNIYPETYIRGMSARATGTLTSVSGNKCFPNNLESTIYQDWGYIPAQPSAEARWIPSSRPLPTPDNLYSYRDAWLENAIREALFQ